MTRVNDPSKNALMSLKCGDSKRTGNLDPKAQTECSAWEDAKKLDKMNRLEKAPIRNQMPGLGADNSANSDPLMTNPNKTGLTRVIMNDNIGFRSNPISNFMPNGNGFRSNPIIRDFMHNGHALPNSSLPPSTKHVHVPPQQPQHTDGGFDIKPLGRLDAQG